MRSHPTLQATLSARLRALRLDQGWSQDTAARRARQAGLAWSQQTVADIERGMRAVTLEDFLYAVPQVYGIAPAALLDGDGWVQLSEGAAVALPALRQVLAGDLASVHDGADVQVATIVAAPVAPDDDTITVTFPHGAPQIIDARYGDPPAVQVAAGGAAERKAARKLGIPTMLLSETSFNLWGRSLSDERDALVDDQAPEDATPRARQALRGHVTRALVAELAEALQKGGT